MRGVEQLRLAESRAMDLAATFKVRSFQMANSERLSAASNVTSRCLVSYRPLAQSLIRREATNRTLMDLCLRRFTVAKAGDHPRDDVRPTQPLVRANQ